MIAEAWRELGLTVEVEAMDFVALIDRVQNAQDFDAAILGWSGRVDRLDPQFFLGLLDSRQAGSGGTNLSGYANPEYDALFQAQSRALDPELRRPAVHAAQALAARDVPIAVIAHRDTVVAHSTTSFAGLAAAPGDGLYTEWNLMRAQPLTARTRLRIGGHQRPDGLNPLASTTSWSWRWMRLYYDYLVRLSPDAEPQLWAAERIDFVSEATLEVTLREGLIFHDGMPVTATDVAFSFNQPKLVGFSYLGAYLGALLAVEAVDARTVRITLKYPSASFAVTALSQIPILPSHIWRHIENPAALENGDVPLVGSGPFRFASIDPGWHMSLDRFEDHFAASDIMLTGVDFLFYFNGTATLSALLGGEVDLTAGTLDPWHVPTVEAASGVGIMTAPDIGFNHIAYNTRRTNFALAGFRRALTHAIDRDRIVDVLLDGHAATRGSLIAPVNRYWHNPDIEYIAFDMAAARAELELAGFAWDDAGQLTMPVQ